LKTANAYLYQILGSCFEIVKMLRDNDDAKTELFKAYAELYERTEDCTGVPVPKAGMSNITLVRDYVFLGSGISKNQRTDYKNVLIRATTSETWETELKDKVSWYVVTKEQFVSWLSENGIAKITRSDNAGQSKDSFFSSNESSFEQQLAEVKKTFSAMAVPSFKGISYKGSVLETLLNPSAKAVEIPNYVTTVLHIDNENKTFSILPVVDLNEAAANKLVQNFYDNTIYAASKDAKKGNKLYHDKYEEAYKGTLAQTLIPVSNFSNEDTGSVTNANVSELVDA